jgi:hypothetical protein
MTQFGNLGLAAAGYNGGPGRVSAWLAGKGGLPAETRNYVAVITGWTADEWASPSPSKNAETTIPQGCPGMGAATRTIIRMGIRAHAPSLVVAPARPSTHAFWSALNSQEGILSSQINASPSGARLRSTTQAWAYRRVWADYTTNMFEFEFPTGQTIVWRGLAASPILKGNLPGR